MNITDPIRRNARMHPGATAAVRSNGASITYRELDRTMDFLGARVLDLGLRPGVTAITKVLDQYRFLVLSLALARVGIAATPDFVPGLPAEICFVDEAYAANPEARTVALRSIWPEGLPLPAQVPVVASHQDGAAICRIFPSSGTTGIPKYIAVSHDLLTRRIFFKWLVTRLPDDARQISFIGMGTHYGFSASLRVLWIGGQLVMPSNVELIIPFIQRYSVNALVLAPITLHAIALTRPYGAGPLPSLEAIEVGGSQLPDGLYDLARTRLCPTIQCTYGTTEAAVVATAPRSALHGKSGAVGYVVSHVEVQTVNEDDTPLPPGTEGILRMRTRNAVDRYLGDPALSASVFKGGWFYPGDVGTVSSAGLMMVGGRASEIINSGGNKVSPHVIEEVLLSLPGIRDAAAFGLPDALGITQIWAAVVRDGALDPAAVQAACRERLRERAPAWFIEVAEVPRNANGKILREELKRTALAAANRNKAA